MLLIWYSECKLETMIEFEINQIHQSPQKLRQYYDHHRQRHSFRHFFFLVKIKLDHSRSHETRSIPRVLNLKLSLQTYKIQLCSYRQKPAAYVLFQIYFYNLPFGFF